MGVGLWVGVGLPFLVWGWPFLLGVGVGPSFSVCELAHPFCSLFFSLHFSLFLQLFAFTCLMVLFSFILFVLLPSLWLRERQREREERNKERESEGVREKAPGREKRHTRK